MNRTGQRRCSPHWELAPRSTGSFRAWGLPASELTAAWVGLFPRMGLGLPLGTQDTFSQVHNCILHCPDERTLFVFLWKVFGNTLGTGL